MTSIEDCIIYLYIYPSSIFKSADKLMKLCVSLTSVVDGPSEVEPRISDAKLNPYAHWMVSDQFEFVRHFLYANPASLNRSIFIRIFPGWLLSCRG